MQKIAKVTIITLLYIFLVGCVTSIDENLPYEELPEITLASPTTLIASPSHPDSKLFSDPISAGMRVRMIGTDQDAAWLLVLNDNVLGWMPTISSYTNIGRLKPAIRIKPLSETCTEYLGATFSPDELWVSDIDGSVTILGSIYRPEANPSFETASLDLEIDGGGTGIAADFVHTPLTLSSAVALFAFSVDDLQKGSQIQFKLTNPSNERLTFQATFFSNDCDDDLDPSEIEYINQLPIGKTQTEVPNLTPTPLPPPTPSTPGEIGPEPEMPLDNSGGILSVSNSYGIQIFAISMLLLLLVAGGRQLILELRLLPVTNKVDDK